MIIVKETLGLMCIVILVYAPSLLSLTPNKNFYSAFISFGDSLSDVGTYGVSAVAAAGGGKYSVNFPGSKIWIERLADEMGLNAPCAAITGLDGSIFGAVSSTQHAGCFGYAQGGARVTNAVGISNTESMFPGSELGALTNAVVHQIQQHLNLVGEFHEHELVAIWAGHNDVLAALTSETPTQDVKQAGEELVLYIKNLIVAKGAQRVVVLNMGNLRYTPMGQRLPLVISTMIDEYINTFNQVIAAGLDDLQDQVLLVDIYTQSQLWGENPEAYGISNLSAPACNLEATLFPSALLCTLATLVSDRTSGYFYADLVHPAPKGHEAIAEFVIEKLKQRRWLAN